MNGMITNKLRHVITIFEPTLVIANISESQISLIIFAFFEIETIEPFNERQRMLCDYTNQYPYRVQLFFPISNYGEYKIVYTRQ